MSPPPVDPGTGVDLLSNPSITTPAGFIIAVLIFIGNQYFRNRQESRSDKESDRTSESGIVETSKAALTVVREQIEQMQIDARETRAETKRREREFLKRIEILESNVEELEHENRQLRRRLGLAPRALGSDTFGEPTDRIPPATDSDGSSGASAERAEWGRRYRYRDEGGA